MTTAHTPGPWRVRQSFDKGEPCCLTVHVGATNIADIFPGEQISQASEEAEANAQLIASAPELLAACKAALPQVQRYECTDPNGECCGNPVIDLLRNAITKAEL